MHFVDLVEVYAFGFVIWDFETIFHGLFWYIAGFFFYGRYIFGAVTNAVVVNI